MKQAGMTLVEILITSVVSVIVAMGVALVARASVNAASSTNALREMSANTRNLLATLNNNIISSNISYLNMKPCAPNECIGEKLLYKEAVEDQTPVAGTIYTPYGKLKFGAEGKQYCYYQYMVNLQNQLVKNLQCNNALSSCGDGTCNGGENVNNCPLDCAVCGDNICSEERNENIGNCPQDCRICGDGICAPGESCTGAYACAVDCGDCSRGAWEW